MTKTRRKIDVALKAKIALEAVREQARGGSGAALRGASGLDRPLEEAASGAAARAFNAGAGLAGAPAVDAAPRCLNTHNNGSRRSRILTNKRLQVVRLHASIS